MFMTTPEDNVFILAAPDANSTGNITIYSPPIQFKGGSPRYMSLYFFCPSTALSTNPDGAEIGIYGTNDLINQYIVWDPPGIYFDSTQQTYFKCFTPNGLFRYYQVSLLCTSYATIYLIGSGF